MFLRVDNGAVLHDVMRSWKVMLEGHGNSGVVIGGPTPRVVVVIGGPTPRVALIKGATLWEFCQKIMWCKTNKINRVLATIYFFLLKTSTNVEQTNVHVARKRRVGNCSQMAFLPPTIYPRMSQVGVQNIFFCSPCRLPTAQLGHNIVL